VWPLVPLFNQDVELTAIDQDPAGRAPDASARVPRSFNGQHDAADLARMEQAIDGVFAAAQVPGRFTPGE